MREKGDKWGKFEIPPLFFEMFDHDLVFTIKDSIQAPGYIETSAEELTSLLKSLKCTGIKRLSRYPHLNNFRRFLSPLYLYFDHQLSQLLYGDGNIQIKAVKGS